MLKRRPFFLGSHVRAGETRQKKSREFLFQELSNFVQSLNMGGL